MKKTLKTIVKGVINAVFNPRKSKRMLEASIMYQKAVDEAEEFCKRDGHRYFVVYDRTQRKLISITYDIYRDRGDSYQYLRQRGRFKSPISRREMKELCFYYTGSQWGAPACSGEEKAEKMKEWQQWWMKASV